METGLPVKRTFVRSELDEVARWLLDTCAGERVFLLDAPMGAGKTTLIKAIIARLSDQEFLGSPTFSLVHEYTGRRGEKIYHFDLYRLKNPEELWDTGFGEYLDTGDYLFIEWPEKALPFLDEYCVVRLTPVDQQTRRLHLQKSTL